MTAVRVRCAVPEDAAVAVTVVRDSITKLCVADHGNDPLTLEPWLRNKTVENFARWISDPENHLVVAELDSAIRGIALLHRSGDIRLCYVPPSRQRCGIGAALLAALETHATAWGIDKLTLKSTVIARAFYEHNGYTPAARPLRDSEDRSAFPMNRRCARRA